MADKKQRPQERWSEKNDYITKGYRMYRSTADAFKAACEKVGVSQSGQIVKMMKEFIEEVNKEE